MPPPPVAGAAVGYGLADLLGDADGLADADGLGDAERLADGLALGVVAPDEAVGVTDALGEADDVGSATEDEDDVHAATAAEARMMVAPQPAAASFARSPVLAVVARSFMKPPRTSGRWRPRSPDPASETSLGRGMRSRPGRCPHRPQEGAESAGGDIGKAMNLAGTP